MSERMPDIQAEQKREFAPLKPHQPETASAEQRESAPLLSEKILGYDNPHIKEIVASAQSTYRDAKGFGIPSSPGLTFLELVEPYNNKRREPLIEEMKKVVKGGVMVNCGYGDYPDDNGVPEKLEISDVVGIEIQDDRIGEVGEFVEGGSSFSGSTVERVLKIREDINVALAQMQSESVDIIYYCALDVFTGNRNFFLREVLRVLKSGGYVIDDGMSNLIGGMGDVVPPLEEIYAYHGARIFKKS